MQKLILDGKDKKIIKALYNSDKPLPGSQIAKRINMSPPAIRPRLDNLASQGIVKQFKIGELRSFNRIFHNKQVKINAPSKILWCLNCR